MTYTQQTPFICVSEVRSPTSKHTHILRGPADGESKHLHELVLTRNSTCQLQYQRLCETANHVPSATEQRQRELSSPQWDFLKTLEAESGSAAQSLHLHTCMRPAHKVRTLEQNPHKIAVSCIRNCPLASALEWCWGIQSSLTHKNKN